MADHPALVCPMCRVELARHRDGFRCRDCDRWFPVVAGIPDLRVNGDAYLSIEDDRRRAEALAAVPGSGEAVLRAYWRATPEVPDDAADRYARHALDGPRRSRPYLDEVGAGGGALLDVGCGTAGLVLEASQRGCNAVGVDLALRWLVVARRLLAEAGCDALLVAADGALLPFRAGSFDVVTCIEVLEHAPDQRGLLQGTLGAVRPGGVGLLVTTNRFSLAPEPSVKLWGLGFVPHATAVRYVAWRRDTRYGFVHPRSRGQLRAMIGAQADTRVDAAPLPGRLANAPRFRAIGESAYERLRRTPGIRVALAAVGPYLQVTRR